MSHSLLSIAEVSKYIFNFKFSKSMLLCCEHKIPNFLLLNVEFGGKAKLSFHWPLTWHLKSFVVTLKICIFRNPSLIDIGWDHEEWHHHIKGHEGFTVLHLEMWKGLQLSLKLITHNHHLCPFTLPLNTLSTSSCMTWARQGVGLRCTLSALSLCVMMHTRQKQQFRR